MSDMKSAFRTGLTTGFGKGKKKRKKGKRK
jgi:hypothetical protein